jgi:U3 small nucleolar RNA-associated protein 23
VVDPKGSGINKHRYVVATQDETVRRKLRAIVGVPLVYIARSVMILEPMASATEDVREREAKAKIKAGLMGRRGTVSGGGEKRKREDEDGDTQADAAKGDAASQKKRKLKGPKGPNPLAVKKPKKEKRTPAQQEADDERTALRRATKNDPQAVEKTRREPDAHEDADEAGERKKRKRKRKPKDASELDGVATSAADSGDDHE